MDEDTTIKAYPLAWPVGRPRTAFRKSAAFRKQRRVYNADLSNVVTRTELVSISEAVGRVMDEMRRFGATNVVISSNVKPTLSGRPSRETPDKGEDPGVAVYFRLERLPHVLCCDRWARVADNLAAIAAHVEATRGQLRWGCATAAQAFAGFRELPAVGQRAPWWKVLGFERPPDSPAVLERKRDELARMHHPDRGGNVHQMAEINAAYDEGRAALGARP